MPLRPHEIYAQKLLHYNHGYALFEADPCGSYDKVRLGDVGYINESGKFLQLFNAFSEDGGQNIDKNDLPKDFKPIDEKYRRPEKLASIKGPLYSIGVVQMNKEVNVNAKATLPIGDSAVGIAGSYEMKFQSETRSGAILQMDYNASREEAISKSAMESYMLKNCRSWLALAKAQGRSVQLHELIFVRDRTLTGNWSAITWHRPSKTASTASKFEIVHSVAKFSVSFSGGEHTVEEIGANQRDGPEQRDARRNAYQSGDFDQCIFIKGIRVALKSWYRKLVSSLKASVDDPKSIDGSCILSTLKSIGFKVVDAGDDVDGSKKVRSIQNAYELLAIYIFERSKADIAILDDGDMGMFPQLSEANTLEDMCDIILGQKGIKVSVSTAQYFEGEREEKGPAKAGRICIDEKYDMTRDKEDGILVNIGKKVKRTISFTPSAPELTGGPNRTKSTTEVQTEI